jgi:thiamine biosynthesis lipoprotein
MTRFSARPAILIASLVLVGCTPAPQPPTFWKIEGPTMGTTFSITISSPSTHSADRQPIEPDLKQISQEAKAVLAEINRTMSTYDPKSEISSFNASATDQAIPISPLFARVVARAKEISTASSGRFDITVSPLVDLWGFGNKGDRHQPPSDQQIELAMKSVGSDSLEVSLDPPTLRKSISSMAINLNAIAPGFAADQLGKLLEEQGYNDYLIDVGGEFLAKGKSPQGGPWRVAIERPDRSGIPKQTVQMVLEVTDRAVATSGDYRQYFEHEGKFYSHTIDPKTGRPTTHRLASATIIANDAMSADGYATAVMVLGPDEGMKWIESLDRVEAILVVRKEDETLETRFSAGAKRLVANSTP